VQSRADDRTPGARFILERAKEGHLVIEMCPNGEAMLCYDPDHKVITFASERHLGKFLAALIVDGGGSWRLCPGRDPNPFGIVGEVPR
jgi:hypothetical protein